MNNIIDNMTQVEHCMQMVVSRLQRANAQDLHSNAQSLLLAVEAPSK
jgi:hypothetical protein